MGLRIREMPLAAGLTLLSGYSGEHPQRRIEAIAVAPYPVAGDIQEGVWLSDATHAVTVVDQAYDFETGELTSPSSSTSLNPFRRSARYKKIRAAQCCIGQNG
jgi:hypothetical protein